MSVLSILGNCPVDIPSGGLAQTVTDFSFDVTIPDDYRTFDPPLPNGTEFGFLRSILPRPGTWLVTADITSGAYTVDESALDDDTRLWLGMGEFGVYIEDQSVAFDGGLQSQIIILGPDFNPKIVRFDPRHVERELVFDPLGGMGQCFATEADIVPLQILLFDYPGPRTNPETGITYDVRDYGFPSSISLHFEGHLVEAAP